MLPQDILAFGKNGNPIREISAYAGKRSREIGADKVFNFSMGNPNVPAPPVVDETLRRLLDELPSVALHSYTPAPGDPAVRAAIAEQLNKSFGADCSAEDIYMTAGASGALAIAMRALLLPGEEGIVFAPYFMEYLAFIASCGGKPVELRCREADFQPDMEALEKAINEKTKLVIINSPNNPSGSVLSEASIIELAGILRRKEREYGHEIYLIADEPYRELVYDADTAVPFVPNYYDDTILCYSYSKCLSIPGERMGYLLVSPKMKDKQDVYAAVCGAGRVLGYINNNSLFQHMLPYCLGASADLSVYKTNRDILVTKLGEYGFSMARPQGAFYIFLKSPEEDDVAFCERAKDYELILVPGTYFGYPGYARVSYCVSTATVKASLPAFKKLAESYALD